MGVVSLSPNQHLSYFFVGMDGAWRWVSGILVCMLRRCHESKPFLLDHRYSFGGHVISIECIIFKSKVLSIGVVDTFLFFRW